MTALTLPGAPRTMNTREVAELTGKRHDHVLRDVEKMVADLDETLPQIWGDLPDAYGRPQRVAFLPKRETLILVSGYSVQMRARIIDRWQELEAGVSSAIDMRKPEQLLAVAMQLTQMCQEQQAQLAAQAPKVQFAEAVGSAEADQRLWQVAKAIGAGPRRLLAFLKDKGVLMRDGLPYQQHIERGRFRVVEVPFRGPDGNDRVRPETRVTGRGITFVQQLFSKDGGATHA